MKNITPGDALTARGEILLVEDSATDAELTQLAFRRARIANPLRVVSSAEEAWQYLLGQGPYAKRGATQPLLILLDLQLPRMSGIELLRQLKLDERTRDLSVVSLSGTTDAPAIVTCLKLGIDDHLIKPIDFKNLVRVTRKLKLRLSRTPPTTGQA
jgi:CheY-like chemotaxis protein